MLLFDAVFMKFMKLLARCLMRFGVSNVFERLNDMVFDVVFMQAISILRTC